MLLNKWKVLPLTMLIDYGNKYNENGKNLQVEYSKKFIGKCPSSIVVKNNSSVVIATIKPVESKLHILNSQENIYKITNNCYVAASGRELDKNYIIQNLKEIAMQYKKMFNSEITSEYIKQHLNALLVYFNSTLGLRVIGAEFIVVVVEKDKYNCLLVENTGSILKYTCAVVGSMSQRAKTEMEKVNWDALNIEEMIDQVVMIFYKCFDPLSDKPFEIEIKVVGKDTNNEFINVEKEVIDKYVARHCDLTIDDQ